MDFRSLRIDSALRNSCPAALTIGLATLVAWASHAGPIGGYCEIDIKCSDSTSGLQDDFCFAVPTAVITFHYDFIGGEAEIIDDQFGVIGIYTGTTLTRTVTISETVTHTATFRPINTVCTTGIFSDSVTVIHGNPTPTPTPTATPTSTPTAPPTPPPTPTPVTCRNTWPSVKIVTIAKGQSPINNSKVAHAITGHIIDPGSLRATAHRIEVCAGTSVTSVVTDRTGTPTNTASGSLACSSAGCSGVVNATEKYRSISEDGRDKDMITFIPK